MGKTGFTGLLSITTPLGKPHSPPSAQLQSQADWLHLNGTSTNRQFLTWRVAEHPKVWLLFCQHPEHHLSGSLPCAVQHPGAERLQGAQRGDVDDGAPKTWTLWKSLHNAGCEAQGGADIEGQVRVHLSHVGEAFGIARHIT